MNQSPFTVADLEQQERELVLEAFTNEDAWHIGSSIVERAIAEKLPVAVDVRRPDCQLFRAALTGTTSDQGEWVERKSATTFRFEASSLLVGLRMTAADHDPFVSGWLDSARYTLAGGSFPVRVTGAGMVAAITVSGLSSEEDHTLIVGALRDYRARPGRGTEGA